MLRLEECGGNSVLSAIIELNELYMLYVISSYACISLQVSK